MNLAAIQIQALVRQAQDQYIIAFTTSIGRNLSGSSERSDIMETCEFTIKNLLFSKKCSLKRLRMHTIFRHLRRFSR